MLGNSNPQMCGNGCWGGWTRVWRQKVRLVRMNLLIYVILSFSNGLDSSPERWCCESAALNMSSNLENSAVATGKVQFRKVWKRSIFVPIPKTGNAKECSNYCTVALISHTTKVMLKILQARLQQYVNCELPDVQAGFRKGRGTRDQIANIC